MRRPRALVCFVVAALAVVATASGSPSLARKLTACRTTKSPFGVYSNVRVSGMSCAAATTLITSGGPVTKGWKCSFSYGRKTFTARCTLKSKYISYAAPLSGGKG